MKHAEKQEQGSAVLSIAAQKTLLQDVCSRPHIEACGVLLGTYDEQGNWSIEETRPLQNIFSSSVYFEFAPEELLTVELAHPGRVVGVYHSHPTGFARASSTDKENMQRVNVQERIPWLWLIIPGPFDSSFCHQPDGLFPHPSILAYHHYVHSGLQSIELHYKQVSHEKIEERL